LVLVPEKKIQKKKQEKVWKKKAKITLFAVVLICLAQRSFPLLFVVVNHYDW